MREQKLFRKQFIKNMIWNFIVFTIIFAVFSTFMFNLMRKSLYEYTDRELDIAKNMGGQVKVNNTDKPTTMQPPPNENRDNKKQENMRRFDFGPDKTYIIRDDTGIIISHNMNSESSEYINNMPFDINKMDEIYEFNVDEYYYKGINTKTISDTGETIYIQIVMSINSEKSIEENYFRIICIGTAIAASLSVIASYILSKRTLKPIIASWKKQTEFVQNASHELRTPLTIIQTKQELLLQEPNAKILDKAEDITITINEARRLAKLTKDLMALARSDTNKMELNKEKFEIDVLLNDIVKPYQDLAKMQKKNIVLKLESKAIINGDVNKIHQLIVILLDNAMKYTQTGDTIEIISYYKDNKTMVEVRDTGIGISEDGMKYIFDRFYREDKARNRETGGSGLGLSIAKMIAEAHNASIKVTKNEPKGSRFVITFK